MMEFQRSNNDAFNGPRSKPFVVGLSIHAQITAFAQHRAAPLPALALAASGIIIGGDSKHRKPTNSPIS